MKTKRNDGHARLMSTFHGLVVSELDTLDATERMARSSRRWALRGGNRTSFQNDDAHNIV